VPKESRGYDAGKKTNGLKCHLVVDTACLLLVVLVTAASVQDRDGGRLVLARARMGMPSIVQVWADGGYVGKLVDFARQMLQVALEIVKKPKGNTPSRRCPAAGWWSGPCRGWCGAAASDMTTNGFPRPRGGHGQMGHDRPHGQAPGTATGPPPLAGGDGKMTTFPTLSKTSDSRVPGFGIVRDFVVASERSRGPIVRNWPSGWPGATGRHRRGTLLPQGTSRRWEPGPCPQIFWTCTGGSRCASRRCRLRPRLHWWHRRPYLVPIMGTDKALDVLETRDEPPVCMSASAFDRSLVFARAQSLLRGGHTP
jgi:hypothetical protein